jgi:Immune inhibitor A peptidase M6.
MCGIGTTTHEFGHSLGLPDFYDTDYATNGEAGGLYDFSTMDGGPYNNNGRTPPYFNAEELMMLGWMDGLTEISSQGTLSIVPIQNRVAYKVPTSTPGEYFVLECRAASGWDASLPNRVCLCTMWTRASV